MKFQVTWYGTAGFLLEADGYRILVDPFFERNARSEPKLTVTKEVVPRVDVIVVTHAHFDHIMSIPYFLHRDHCRVIASAQLRDNITHLANGDIFPGWPDGLDPTDLDFLDVASAGKKIELSPKNGAEITVTSLHSAHCVFDIYQVLRLIRWEVIKNLRKLAIYLKGFPMGEVFVHLIRWGGKNIFIMGTLSAIFLQDFLAYLPCDALFIALAGRNDIAPLGLKITGALKPRVIVPTHFDHFFPPISQWTSLEKYERGVTKDLPETRIVKPEIGVPFSIDL